MVKLPICYFNKFLDEVTNAKCWLTNLYFESIHKHYSYNSARRRRETKYVPRFSLFVS